MYTISVSNQLFVDSYLVDDDNTIIFVSLWGRDTSIQQFIARLTLPAQQDGFDRFYISIEGREHLVRIPNVDNLTKYTGYTCETELGKLNQLILADTVTVQPDYANSRAILIQLADASIDPWSVVQQLCQVPLLDHWRHVILEQFSEREWITSLTKGIGVYGLVVHLPEIEVVETTIRDLLLDQKLDINVIPQQSDRCLLGQ